MNWLKKPMLFRLLVLAIQSRKKDCDTIIGKIEKKILDQDNGKYTATQEFNKLMEYNSAAKLKQANLASKNDITDLVKNRF